MFCVTEILDLALSEFRILEYKTCCVSCVSYHVLHSAQILGTLGVAVVFSQVCCCEAVLVTDAKVHPIDHKDLTALRCDMRETEGRGQIRTRWRK